MRTGVWAIDGRGRPSEDRSFIQDVSGEFLIAGVFDGHSGSATVDLTIKHFPEKLAELVRTAGNNEQALRTGLHNLFIDHDKFVAKQGALHYRDSGSTATVAIITETHCYIAYIGDSPAFIFDPDTGSVISSIGKHNPDRHDEKGRIEKNGGYVSAEEDDAPRVDGCLMVSRAFGDFSLKFKNAKAPEFEKDWSKDFRVVATPDILVINRPTRGALLICSDGLVDTPEGTFRSSNEIGSEIFKLSPGLPGDLTAVAKQLIENQIKVFADTQANYTADDITVVLVDFSKAQQKGGVPLTRKMRRRRRAHTKRTQGLPKTFMI